jgi:hypothetical protein
MNLLLSTATNAAPSDLRVVLIGAGAAVLGAVVGGLLTGWVSLRAEDKRQNFQRELDAASAQRDAEHERLVIRGLARATRTQLLLAVMMIRASARTGAWWPVHQEIEIRVEHEDRKQLASHLAAEAWTEIETAEAMFANLVARRGTRQRYRDHTFGTGPLVFDASDRDLMRSTHDNLVTAMNALATLSGMPNFSDDFPEQDSANSLEEEAGPAES